MISKPKHGWCSFRLGDFTGSPSYLTDVPVDLLDAFINYHKIGYGVAVFDEEGCSFTLVMTQYNSSIYIIEEKDSAVLHYISDLRIEDLKEELINDIEQDIDGWVNFEFYCSDDEIAAHEETIMQKLEELKGMTYESSIHVR